VGPVVTTSAATIITPDPARDAVVDKATIAGPEVVAQAEGTNGHRSASIAVADVPNFDPTKTWATLMIVDKNGSTTAIGLDGVGKVVGVDWLSPNEEYEIKVVLRDLGTGQETTISGSRLP
jgi:putative ribosome biogenesis GTPase RsgA